jgi:hypothetical protein
MINIKVLRAFRNGIGDSRVLSVDEILNAKWSNDFRFSLIKSKFSSGVYEYFQQGECYILYFPEAILKNIDFFESIVGEIGDYFDEYTLTEEQFQFLKLKIP